MNASKKFRNGCFKKNRTFLSFFSNWVLSKHNKYNDLCELRALILLVLLHTYPTKAILKNNSVYHGPHFVDKIAHFLRSRLKLIPIIGAAFWRTLLGKGTWKSTTNFFKFIAVRAMIRLFRVLIALGLSEIFRLNSKFRYIQYFILYDKKKCSETKSDGSAFHTLECFETSSICLSYNVFRVGSRAWVSSKSSNF